MRTYVKKAERELKRLVEQQKQQNIRIPEAFDLDYIPHYCLLGKDMKTGKVHPYTLEENRLVKGCTYFSEQECMNIYRAAVKIMRNNSNLKLAIFDTVAMDGEPKYWRPNKKAI